jgi:hypothetical protein
MKLFLLVSFILLVTKENCKQKKTNITISATNCYKGKLEVKGGCMNYTISVVNSNIDTSLIVANWTDENTGKSYKNAFALGSRCNFPDTINVGDEFYFSIDSTTVQNCAVCLIYYPTPPKKLSIKVLPTSCQ